MKEYLINHNNAWNLALIDGEVARGSDIVSIPNGAELLVYNDKNRCLYHFVDGNNNLMSCDDIMSGNGYWYEDGCGYLEDPNTVTAWKRETKPMKEYLTRSIDGEYTLTNHKLTENDIEVPEGAEIAIKFKNDSSGYGVIFYKNNGGSVFSEKRKNWENGSNWTMSELLDENYFYEEMDLSHHILWKRHTKPEELPFMDSLNDQYAEIERVRQSAFKPTDFGVSMLPEFRHDFVNHPKHYCDHPSGIECIEITRHHDFAIGNAIKYLWRAGLKDSDNEIQDLKKAVWYIHDKIAQLENK